MSDARKHLLVLIWTKHICKGCFLRALLLFPTASGRFYGHPALTAVQPGGNDKAVRQHWEVFISLLQLASAHSLEQEILLPARISYMDLPPEPPSCAHDGQTSLANSTTFPARCLGCAVQPN